jgi:hypothetical protein
MRDRILARMLLCATSIGALLSAGCQNTKPLPDVPDNTELAACPDPVQSNIALRVSVSARELPKELVTSEGVPKGYPFLGRKMLFAIVPHGAARDLTILDSDLTVAPAGGTFEGWATSASASGGIDVVPGRLRIDPILAGGRFRPQTSAVDAVIRLGGAPFDQAVMATGALWDGDQHPISPDVLQVTFTPLRHFTVYDAVNATVTLRLVAQPAHTDLPCRATVETIVQLVDREAARPPLWDLGTSYRGGARKRWLALYDPHIGPVRAIFTDPVAARGFAMWVRQTGATQVGRFQLGTFESEDLRGTVTTVPTDRAIMQSYRAITPEERAALVVGPLGEP